VFARITNEGEQFNADFQKTKDIPEIIVLEKSDKNPPSSTITRATARSPMTTRSATRSCATAAAQP